MSTPHTNREQRNHWAGAEGDHWVRYADRHDAMLAPFAEALAGAAAVETGARVLDVGCGCGATTIAAAVDAGPEATALGVDLSPQMLEVARTRAALAGVGDRTRFVVADAQTADLGAGRWDVAISRFGMMFFDDPSAGFGNIAEALRPGGRLAFCCWQPLAANDWMLVPGAAAAQHVPLPAGLDGDQPGPFSLGDPDRIIALLAGAGFEVPTVDPITSPILLGGGGTLDETMAYLEQSGAGRALLDGVEERARGDAIDAVRAALEPFCDADGVRLGGSAWIVTARRPSG